MDDLDKALEKIISKKQAAIMWNVRRQAGSGRQRDF